MKKRSGFDLRFQWQPGDRPIPRSSMSEYDYGLGASVVYEWNAKLSFGAAYNVARVPDVTEELEELGITGDAEAFLLGAMYRDEPLYFAVNYTQHKNHDTDDRGQYIEARGVELYARFTFAKRYRAVTGFNLLDPRRRPDGGRYNIHLGFFGFQYSLRNVSFATSSSRNSSSTIVSDSMTAATTTPSCSDFVGISTSSTVPTVSAME